MKKIRFPKPLIIALGLGALALALLSTDLLLAQGSAPAPAPAAMAPAPRAMAPAPAAMAPVPGAMAPQPPAGAAPGAGMAPEGAAVKPPEIPEKDRKLELARVGDVVITVGELAERINRMSRYVRGRYESIEKKRGLLDSMIEFEVLAKEASRRGFEKHPDVVQMLRQVMIQRLRQKVVEDGITRESISDADVNDYYEKNKAQYNKPETVRISHILVKDETTAKKVLEEVKSKGNDPRNFRAIVQQYSVDEATKQRAGDLRYFTRDEKRVPAPVIEAAFKLEKRGDVAGPIKSEAGFHVIKLTHRREAINRPAQDEKVKNQIVTRILRDKRKDALENFKKNLRDKAKVTINDDRLAAVKIDTTIQQRGGEGRPGPKGGRLGRPPGGGPGGPGGPGGLRIGPPMGPGPGMGPRGAMGPVPMAPAAP
ncbi:MAG: peptidyl-prolyl cis-trans isomerase [Polyangia bacterium]|nr:peptidyl-prolyl cis-trans isomerase [Polyangia bacterium]